MTLSHHCDPHSLHKCHSLFWRKTFPLPLLLLVVSAGIGSTLHPSFNAAVLLWDTPNRSYNKLGWDTKACQAPKERLKLFFLVKNKNKTEGERSSVLQRGCLQCKGTVVILQTLLVKACPASGSTHPALVSLGRGRLCWLLRAHV